MKYLSIIIFLWGSTLCSAQTDTEALDFELIAAAHNDKVILRWAPSNERSWLNWSGVNIQVYRRPLDTSGKDQVLPLELVVDGIKAWTEDEYEIYANQNFREDSLVMLAGYLMHAPYETTNEKMTMQNMVDRKEELANRFSTALYSADMNPLAAEALGMRAEDDNSLAQAYYTVIVTWENGDQSHKTVRYDPLTNLIPSAGRLRGKEMEEYVVLSWDQAFHKKHFTAYWIEKSLEGNSWKRLNDIPFVHAFDSSLPRADDDFVYIDSVANYNPHLYRIVGISPFGVESAPSKAIQLQGRDRTPPSPPTTVEAIMKDATTMSLSWNFEDTSEDIAGFIVKRDGHYDGDFSQASKVLNKTTRTFEDDSPSYLSKNYYLVCAIDTAGNESCSLPTYGFLNDTIPPEKPIGLNGKIDTNGIVTLEWTANKEIDLSGYHVYLSNRKDGVFSKLTETPVKNIQFRDTISLNTLTEDIYYAITAEDVRSNVSNFSDRVQLMKPDTIAPGPAVFKDYKTDQNGIYLSWSPSASRDVTKQYLWRTSGEERLLVIESDMTTTSFTDSEVSSGINYTYELITEDDAGLKTNCPNPLKITGSALLGKPKVALTLIEENESQKIVVTVSGDQELSQVVIYKSIDNKPYASYKIFKSSQESFTYNQNEKASYKAIAITNQGIKSDASIIKIN
jgi:hypothetical protein